MSTNQVAAQEKQDLTMSQRFTNKVMAEFQGGVGKIELNEFQKRLGQNYFMAIDIALSTAEASRLKKTEKYRDALPVTWNSVDMEQLARDVVTYARIGLDPMQKNHIHVIPFKNNTTNKYDITFMEGYRGLELKAQKYGLDVPDAVIVEVVYSNDHFKAIKKDMNNKVESYEFEVKNAFDRGEVVGGFYYHSYNDNPSRNKLVVMTVKDIEKRKPRYASAEFWGGEKDEWKNGAKTGKKEKVDGWYEEMCRKTIHRAAYNDITIDSQKIDDDYLRLKQLESEAVETKVEVEIKENANKQPIGFDDENIVDVEAEVVEEVETVVEETKEENEESKGPGY